ncbi:MAG: YbaK/EbsC family protein [Bellilinea sp.]
MNTPLLEEVVVIKQNLQGEETWRYSGQILQSTPDARLLTARFNREDTLFQGILLKQGDPFIEAYYSRRWFNIFEVRDRDDGQTKGWYCNITRPAKFEDGFLSYVDLALDLLVYPDGHWLLLDEDEYAALRLNQVDHAQAMNAVEALKHLFSLGAGFRLDQIFPVIDPYEARLRTVIAENGWAIEHLSFEESTHSVAEAARVVKAAPEDLVKNICLITPDDRLVVAIVKGEDRVSVENVAYALGLNGKPRLATADEILDRTGYPMGGTPSFGFDALFLMDERIFEKDVVYTGGGSPSSLVRADPRELQRANRALTACLRK